LAAKCRSHDASPPTDAPEFPLFDNGCAAERVPHPYSVIAQDATLHMLTLAGVRFPGFRIDMEAIGDSGF